MSSQLILPQAVEAAIRRINPSTSRRGFLKSSGALVVTLSMGTLPATRVLAQAAGAGPYPDPDYLELDTWIVIHPDNTATFFVGKTDGGQGTGTAFRQMMCDELDIAYEKTQLVMGSTDITPDQGGSGGSDGVERDGWPMRRTAAEARRVLLELASERLDTPVGGLTVSDATISVAADPARSVTYAELIGGQRFDVALTGNDINATTGLAKVKPVQELHVIGQSIPRYDIPGKVEGTNTWAVDVKLPGMVHARNVKPPIAGAMLKSIDESSVADLPGFVAVINRRNYVAVICEREEQAIQAARQLKVEWEPPAEAPFPASEALFDFIRNAAPMSSDSNELGDPEAALTSAARVIEAEFEVPFQGHTSIGPAHAMADPSNGQITIYSNDMKSYGLRNGVAAFLGMPREQVRVVYMDGPQVYGRTAADDVGFEAAFLAHELGRPVRVQWMRDEETAWDTKGPAYTFTLRGGLDADGRVIALDYEARAIDYNHVGYNEPDTVLIAQLMGIRPQRGAADGRAATPASQYAIANQRMTGHVVSLPQIWETPLRTGNLRDPNGPQVTFAFESFIDELATAAGADAVQFRLDMIERSDEDERLRRARSLATVRAAAEKYGWDTRPSPNPRVLEAQGPIATGRGIAFTHRNGTVVATIAEVDVNRETGGIWVKRLVCAHDCGLVINPLGLTQTVECGMLHGLSRALWEEVQFDGEKVTSIDWATHPSLRHADTPESVEVVIVNGDPNPDRPDLPHYGAGEASHKPVVAAVANAVHDATGVRLRRMPFRRERVLEALRAYS